MAKSLEGVFSTLSIAVTGAPKPPLNIVERQSSRLIYAGVKVRCPHGAQTVLARIAERLDGCQ